jgi:hypothetical protein
MLYVLLAGLIFFLGSKIRFTRRIIQSLSSFLCWQTRSSKSHFLFSIFRPYRPNFISFQHNEEFIKLSSRYKVESVSDIKPDMETGDILLCVAKLKDGASNAVKWASGTAFSHIAVILIENNNIFILETSFDKNAVHVVPLETYLKNDKYSVLAYRKLNYDRDENFEKTAYEFKVNSLGKKHDANNLKGGYEMVKSALDLKIPLIGKELFVNSRNSDAYFCVELVADLYMQLGLIPSDADHAYPSPNEYTISDFSTISDWATWGQEKENISNLNNGGKLETEVFLEY